jgi:HK97 family phage major capsid protein/HK97 family phage prohead protease
MKRQPKTKELAFSVLKIKAIDEDQRIITGIATTPTPDRVGDIVEPQGAEFELPLPLLKHHDAECPIGQVLDATVTDEGIAIRAQIFKAASSPELIARLDMAWEEIKLGLIRGLSIGFSPVEYSFIEGDGWAMRFIRWMWLELSCVTIPANQEATIATVKSLDSSRGAASGKPRVVHATKALPGASGSSTPQAQKGSGMKKPIADQIKTWENTRAAKAAARSAIMEKADETGTTLDAAQKEQYDTLTSEIADIDEHLTRLRAEEKSVAASAAAAAPITGATPEQASQSRAAGNRIVSVTPNLPKGIEFARYAMCLASAKGNHMQAEQIAKARYPDMTRIHEVMKAAVAAGTTTDPAWAGDLVQYQQFAGDFVDFLRPQTIIGRFGQGNIPSLRAVPFNVQIKGQTSGASGYWVGQGKPKPLTKFDVDAQALRWAKVANIAVITEELARFSTPSAEALVRDELAKAIIERLDIDFINPAKAAVADVSPASITNGATAVASSGTDAAAVETDVAALFNAFIASNLNLAQGVWIMSATTALSLTMMKNALGQRVYPEMTLQGGTFYGLPVIVSQYAALDGSPGNSIVVLLNASDIWLADDGQVVIDISREASLEMSDSPTNSVATGSPEAPVATSLVSLWQTNSIGIKAERFINWARRRATAVAYLTGVNWSGVSGSPA